VSLKLSVDVAIIGAGTAGMRAYREASKITKSIVLIEGGQYGTTCARVGCMPSKLLIAAAEVADVYHKASQFGINYSAPEIDGKAVLKRVREERDRFVRFVLEAVESWPKQHRITGHARFKSDHILQVGETEIEADRVVIATGSRTNIINPLKDFGDRLITSEDIFYWDDLPGSIAVFGAGVIGLELSQALSRLGVSVTLFGKDNHIGPISDPKITSKAIELFSKQLNFYPDAEVLSRYVKDGKAYTEFQDKDEIKTASYDYVLAATGRIPNVDKLGLENTTLPLDERGIPRYNPYNGRIGDSHVFIAGDANNRLPLLHEAADEGMIAGFNAARYPDIRTFKKRAPISVIFSAPQIMMVGQSYKALLDLKCNFAIGELDWQEQGRARVMLVNNGLLRVYGEKNTGRFLGAEMIGPSAEHLAHLLAWAYQSQLTVSEMLERPFYHPVIEEGLRTALRDLNYNLEMGPKSPARCIDCGPGN